MIMEPIDYDVVPSWRHIPTLARNKAGFLWNNRRSIAQRTIPRVRSQTTRFFRGVRDTAINTRDVSQYMHQAPGKIYRGVKPTVAKDIRAWKKVGRASKHVPKARIAGYGLAGLWVGAAFVGGDDVKEGALRAGGEAAAMGGSAVMGVITGAAFAVGGFLVAGPAGAVAGYKIGTMVGSIGGYMAFGETMADVFQTKKAPVFEDVYLNQRARTMREASLDYLAITSRTAFGNEAQMMHLR